jgi:hypothetical protein
LHSPSAAVHVAWSPAPQPLALPIRLAIATAFGAVGGGVPNMAGLQVLVSTFPSASIR